MSDKYTKEDILAFERKDKLNARMSAIKAASTIHEGSGTIPITKVLNEAEEYYAWLIQDQPYAEIPNEVTIKALTDEKLIPVTLEEISMPNHPEYPTVKIVTPTPTTTQLKWLKNIEDQYHFTKEQVFEKYGKYPNSKEQAIEAIKIMKGK